MIAIATFFISIFLIRRKLKTSPITLVFIVSIFLKVIVSFYIYNDLSFTADILAAITIGIILILSAVHRNEKKRFKARIEINTTFVLYVLILANLLFILPFVVNGTPPPVIVSITDGYHAGHYLRVFLTKESGLGLLIQLVGKFVMPLCILALGLIYSRQARRKRAVILLFIFITVLTTSSYLQKALPITTMLSFYLGLLLAGTLNKKQLVIASISVASIIMLFSRLFVEDWQDSIIKFNDLIFRRLGEVPADVYQHYVLYKDTYGITLLKDNFTFLTNSTSPLPRKIYNYMGYGINDGWANGFFVGDVYVNFGVIGVILVSMLLAKLIRMGNYFVLNDKTISFTTLTKYVSICSICFYLPGNAFFSGVIFMFLTVYGGSIILEKIRIGPR